MNPRAFAWQVYQLKSSSLRLYLIAVTAFVGVAIFIGQKSYSLGWAPGIPGSPTFPDMTAPDGVGRYNRYHKGSIYWAPRAGAQEVEVHSPIHDKWISLGGASGFLGSPISPERTVHDGVGRYRRYQGGSIYWAPHTGAHEVHGAIRDKWASLGWECGYGYPITDELGTADGFWRFNHFEHGSIFWSIETGAVDYASGRPGNALGRNPLWGLLANPGFEGRPMKSAFFFAGDWKFSGFIDPQCNNLPGFSKFYEYCTGPNDFFYTVHPSDARDLGWSESLNFRRFALDRMIAAGVNVVNMSYWGKRGTDRWAYWAPMQTSTFAHDELFDVAVEKNLLIAPYIEGGACTNCNDPGTGQPRGGNSPAFEFADDFPGSRSDPSPALVEQIVDLVNRYLLHPEKPEWPARWAQMYDQSGQKRYVVSIIHASSRQPGVDDHLFAEGLNRVASKVAQRTGGVLVGFTLDVIPQPTGYYPTPDSARGTPHGLLSAKSLLAIECFIPEISAAGGFRNNQPHPSGHIYGPGPRQGEPILIDSLDLGRLISWKENFVRSWVETGIPVILDVAPGYDAHIVFAPQRPEDPIALAWGNNNQWRNAQTRMIAVEVKGITINSWNGYTEAMAAVPTLEFNEANYLWLKSLNALIP